MKAHLMYRDADFDPKAADPPGSADLEQDLELGYLLDAMAEGDAFSRGVARAALLHPLSGPVAIRYRQDALADCGRNREAIGELYEMTGRALETERSVLFFLMSNTRPQMLLSRAVGILRLLFPIIGELHDRAAVIEPAFTSDAFRGFFTTIRTELDEAALQQLRTAVRRLEMREGLLMSAALGGLGDVTGQVLRLPREENRHLLNRTPLKRPNLSFAIPERDEAGLNALAALNDRSVNDVANAASQAVDHVLAFFTSLRAELAFYLGCLHLADRLTTIGVPLATPTVAAAESADCEAVELVDPCLALRTGEAPVGNDLRLGPRRLLVVTGANHGGKSTLLRSLGVAQLMMQAGMFVPARRLTNRTFGSLFTHWAREEDEGLVHGKLDEELARMSAIVDVIAPGDLLLSNESFSSTNESEGSEIALQVIHALLAGGVEVRLVTHLYELATALQRNVGEDALFLRAPRKSEEGRNYRLQEGPPQRTSWGVDLFDEAFGTHLAAATSEEGRAPSTRP